MARIGYLGGADIGAAWIKDGKSRPGETCVSVVIAASETPRTLYAKLGQTATQAPGGGEAGDADKSRSILEIRLQ